MKRGDMVRMKTTGPRDFGIVLRVARDGSWADVEWYAGGNCWRKRQPDASKLEVVEELS